MCMPSTPTHNWPGGDHQQNYSHCVHAVQMQSACGISALVMELPLGGEGISGLITKLTSWVAWTINKPCLWWGKHSSTLRVQYSYTLENNSAATIERCKVSWGEPEWVQTTQQPPTLQSALLCMQVGCTWRTHIPHACAPCICIIMQYAHSTVQLQLSEPFWPAPKSKHSDKQKVWIIESIFDVQLTTPIPINYSVYLKHTKHFNVSSHFGWE